MYIASQFGHTVSVNGIFNKNMLCWLNLMMNKKLIIYCQPQWVATRTKTKGEHHITCFLDDATGTFAWRISAIYVIIRHQDIQHSWTSVIL
jgi:hypothetical protein